MENKKPFYGRIYVHKNKLNGKCYVGQTVQKDIVRRWGKHGENYDENQKFGRAIKKYGWDNFEHIILPTIYKTREELNSAEINFIEEFNSYKDGYNCTTGGGGISGYSGYSWTMSDMGKENIGKAQRGKKLSESHKNNISKGGKGISHDLKPRILKKQELFEFIKDGNKSYRDVAKEFSTTYEYVRHRLPKLGLNQFIKLEPNNWNKGIKKEEKEELKAQ